MDTEEPGRSATLAGSGRLRRYPFLVLLGSIPVLALAGFAWLVSARAVASLVHRGNDAAAMITAAMVEREFEHWTATLGSLAASPALATAVEARDAEGVRRRLEVFITAHERLDRAFVTDTTGLLWTDWPRAPESLGRRFADRDWFRGVSRARGAYVSEVYRRNAQPPIQVVAVAAPVRSPASGGVAGYLVAQVRLDDLTEFLARVEVGEEGFVLLRDHRGALAAHPRLDLPLRSYPMYANVMAGEGPDGLEPARGRYADPLTGRSVLASHVRARVGDHAWSVISQQPAEAAFAPARGLALTLGGAGLLLGGLMGVLLWGVGREGTRRLKAERELVALNEELERRVEERTAALRDREDQLLQSQKMDAVGRLAGGVAHDFNNLLTVILTSTDLLLSDLPEDAPARREVEDVREAAQRAAGLTRQLLAFSRKQVLQPEVLDVNEALTRMRGILERVLREDIELIWRLRPGLHPVKFDPVQIEQVLMNLVVNARDAMPTGGRVTIETANVTLDEDYVEEHPGARSGPHVMLAVSDDGEGMDRETRERVFEPFFTTKGRGQGTGLGLSTVYGIVRQGGGNIWVYSEPGLGTTFKVYLPRTDEVPAAEPEEVADAPGAGVGTVLVVEDEPLVRSLLVRVLSTAGYEVLEAGDAAEGERAFRSSAGRIDLLLTDVVLPDRSGPELAAALDGEESLRVLYMSGYPDDTVFRHGALPEGVAYLQKPIRPLTLLMMVRDVLSKSPA